MEISASLYEKKMTAQTRAVNVKREVGVLGMIIDILLQIV